MENGRTYRIKANPGVDKNIHLDLAQNYDTFEILSVKLDQENDFKLHSSNYGIVVGRVLANGGFGVPNAKISAFIKVGDDDAVDKVIKELYPFTSYNDMNNGIRYNVLPSYEVDKCHQPVGSLPSKEYILDNDVVLEVFEKYYKFTTRTNNSGDFLLSGIPVGTCDIHMDLDISDCGILSQRPRDFLYKGHSIEEFESPNQFKKDKNLDYLSQIISENSTIEVIPFWGNESLNTEIGITRCDINVTYKFEPTCVFMGSLIGDGKSAGISQQCVPSDSMGNMDELVSGTGTIEMIRKTLTDEVEEFQVKGTELINSDGVWCYQIPMNLDYMTTDEYGNLVPTDDPEKGIPTRTRVRFRVSMEDSIENKDFYFRGKILVPNNPDKDKDIDYNFGTFTKDESFRDLFWDNVYTVKSYIPRFQRGGRISLSKDRFTGIKHCNISGNNSPMPYNNLRIKLPFMFSLMCSLIHTTIGMLKFWNSMVNAWVKIVRAFAKKNKFAEKVKKQGLKYGILKGGLCPELENWYFTPLKDGAEHIFCDGNQKDKKNGTYCVDMLEETFNGINDLDDIDSSSNDQNNISEEQEYQCITTKTDFVLSCIEMNLAQEYKVINFDFYNDWINGVVYFPRWVRKIRKKRKVFFNLIPINEKTRGCIDNKRTFAWTRRYVQQCALTYSQETVGEEKIFSKIETNPGCVTRTKKGKRQLCHKQNGALNVKIFENNGGIVHEEETFGGDLVYYMRPCELLENKKKVNLFATDIVLLGSLKEENIYGIPQPFRHLSNSSYQMPTNIVLTNVEENGFIYTDKDSKSKCYSAKGEIGYGSKTATIERKAGKGYNEIKEMYRDGDPNMPEYSKSDDMIPRNEVAGISWDFEGYNVGENNFDELYYPGGHFLGMSCTTPSTNIKTCVNLSRICEQGIEMSSRQENIGNGEKVKDTYRAERYYIVPNGLISGDEVSDDDFRNMFASLNNSKQYFDTKGGRVSDLNFKYINSEGFSGEMKSRVNGNEYYNHQIDNIEIREREIEPESFDINEDKKTFKRSLEEHNLGYYKFRLGIDNTKNAKEKYLYERSNNVGLPQYENSFYFYFGLKDGATALDILNRDFFSICKGKEIPDPKPQAEIDGIHNECSMTDDLEITTINMNPPIIVELYKKNGSEESEDLYRTVTSDSDTFKIEGIEMGEYVLKFRDVRDAILTTAYKNDWFNSEKIENNFQGEPFKVVIDETLAKDILEKEEGGKRDDIGGCFNISQEIKYFHVENGEEKDIFINVLAPEKNTKLPENYSYQIKVSDGDGKNYITRTITKNKPFEDKIKIPQFNGASANFITGSSIPGKCNFHLWSGTGTFTLSLGTKCNGNNDFNYLTILTFSVSTDSSLVLYQGNKELPYRGQLEFLKKEWYKNIDYIDDKEKSEYFLNEELEDTIISVKGSFSTYNDLYIDYNDVLYKYKDEEDIVLNINNKYYRVESIMDDWITGKGLFIVFYDNISELLPETDPLNYNVHIYKNKSTEGKKWLLRHFCINRSSDEEYGKDTGIIYDGSDIYDSNIIFSGNPEKQVKDIYSNNIFVPFIEDIETDNPSMKSYLDNEQDKFNGYILSPDYVFCSNGEYSLTISNIKKPYVINRPAFGTFGYTGKRIAATNVISDNITVKDSEKRILKAIIRPEFNDTIICDKQLVNGQKAVIFMSDTKKSVVIVDIYDSYYYIDGNLIYVMSYSKEYDNIIKDKENRIKDEDGKITNKINGKLYPFYYYPIIRRPMWIYSNILSEYSFLFNDYFRKQILSDVEFLNNFKGIIKVYNNNLFNFKNKHFASTFELGHFPFYKFNSQDLIYKKTDNESERIINFIYKNNNPIKKEYELNKGTRIILSKGDELSIKSKKNVIENNIPTKKAKKSNDKILLKNIENINYQQNIQLNFSCVEYYGDKFSSEKVLLPETVSKKGLKVECNSNNYNNSYDVDIDDFPFENTEFITASQPYPYGVDKVDLKMVSTYVNINTETDLGDWEFLLYNNYGSIQNYVAYENINSDLTKYDIIIPFKITMVFLIQIVIEGSLRPDNIKWKIYGRRENVPDPIPLSGCEGNVTYTGEKIDKIFREVDLEPYTDYIIECNGKTKEIIYYKKWESDMESLPSEVEMEFNIGYIDLPIYGQYIELVPGNYASIIGDYPFIEISEEFPYQITRDETSSFAYIADKRYDNIEKEKIEYSSKVKFYDLLFPKLDNFNAITGFDFYGEVPNDTKYYIVNLYNIAYEEGFKNKQLIGGDNSSVKDFYLERKIRQYFFYNDQITSEEEDLYRYFDDEFYINRLGFDDSISFLINLIKPIRGNKYGLSQIFYGKINNKNSEDNNLKLFELFLPIKSINPISNSSNYEVILRGYRIKELFSPNSDSSFEDTYDNFTDITISEVSIITDLFKKAIKEINKLTEIITPLYYSYDLEIDYKTSEMPRIKIGNTSELINISDLGNKKFNSNTDIVLGVSDEENKKEADCRMYRIYEFRKYQ